MKKFYFSSYMTEKENLETVNLESNRNFDLIKIFDM